MEKKNRVIKGIAASPGIAIGPAYMFTRQAIEIHRRRISEDEIPAEIVKFEEAITKTREELLSLKQFLSDKGAHPAKIFEAHLLLLEDRMLVEDVIRELKEKKLCVEYVFSVVLRKYINAFSQMSDPYIRERIADISDVGKRIQKHLVGRSSHRGLELENPSVVVAYDLSPSDTVSMSTKNLLAFITDIGGKTSHTAIIAKSLEVPAVVGLQVATRLIQDGDLLIVDGDAGIVIIDPDEKTVEQYEKRKRKTIVQAQKLESILKGLPSETKDGHRVVIAANIEFPEEVNSVLRHGAEAVGLFRTEFLYMGREDLPSEEEQFEVYKKVVERMNGKEVIIRTLDIGGDKFLSQIDTPKEMHSFLGWRAIRFCLARKDIFKVQLRAILRASNYGKVKVMFPMISCVSEIHQAKQIIAQVKRELSRKRVPYDKDIEIGAMIEVPSAAIVSDILAKEVDFFSIGTNDLVQYTVAVDRANEKVAYLYRSTHLAVLRLIKMVIDNAHRVGIRVGMCGEMAGELPLVVLLLGMGLDEFSVPPISVPKIKYIIREITYQGAKQIAKECLAQKSADDIEQILRSKIDSLLSRCVDDNVCSRDDLWK